MPGFFVSAKEVTHLAIIFIWKIAGDSNGSDGSRVFSDDLGKLNATFLGWRRGKDY